MKDPKQYLESLDARMREMRLEMAADAVIVGKSTLTQEKLEQYRRIFDNYIMVGRSAGLIPEPKSKPAELEKIAEYGAHLSKVG